MLVCKRRNGILLSNERFLGCRRLTAGAVGADDVEDAQANRMATRSLWHATDQEIPEPTATTLENTQANVWRAVRSIQAQETGDWASIVKSKTACALGYTSTEEGSPSSTIAASCGVSQSCSAPNYPLIRLMGSIFFAILCSPRE